MACHAQMPDRVAVQFHHASRCPPHFDGAVVGILGQQAFSDRCRLCVRSAVEIVRLKNVVRGVEDVAAIAEHGFFPAVVARFAERIKP